MEPLGIRIAVFLGIVLLMTAKPELPESLGIVGGSVVLRLAAAADGTSGGLQIGVLPGYCNLPASYVK